MTEIIDFVEARRRQQRQQIVAAFDAAFLVRDTWPAAELFDVIRELAPGTTDDQIAVTLRTAKRFDLPAAWGAP
jgi:hypothetical protein